MGKLALKPEESPFAVADAAPLDPAKFRDPYLTRMGEKRAWVGLERLETLWINTGTLCNLACASCYIESSPTNDALAYLSLAEAEAYFEEAAALGTRTIGFTGGEPFMNPEIAAMLDEALGRGYRVLVLTNAMRPMLKAKAPLLALRQRYGHRLTLRVSIDHRPGEQQREADQRKGNRPGHNHHGAPDRKGTGRVDSLLHKTDSQNGEDRSGGP